jgi:hypothetical protein
MGDDLPQRLSKILLATRSAAYGVLSSISQPEC